MEPRELGATSVDKPSFSTSPKCPQVPRPWRKSRLAEGLFDLSSPQEAALGALGVSRGLS